MKITYINVAVASLFVANVSSAMIGQSVRVQDKIMNQEMKPVQFSDVVRTVEQLEDGTYKVTFQKHAAIYKMDAIKGKTMVDLLKKSQATKAPLSISILPGHNQLLQVIE